MKKTNITIGIPAYNEEANIANLLKNLIAQKQENIRIKQIIVVSDKSDDNTVSEIKSVKSKLVKLLQNKKRSGVSFSQNKIAKLADTDILVLLDADIIPANEFFLEEITKYIREKKADLVGADVLPVISSNFFEKVINDSHIFKRDIFKKFKNGNNLYNCPGRARAFSKELYKSLKYDSSYCEDTFSYLFALDNGFKFKFAPKAKVYFRAPNNLADHLKQSVRFKHDTENMKKHFDDEFVESEYNIPVKRTIIALIDFMIHNPASAAAYLCVLLYTRVVAFLHLAPDHAKINPSTSTKTLQI